MCSAFITSMCVTSYGKKIGKSTNARMQAVTPVPHAVTTGFSSEMPEEKNCHQVNQ